MTMYALGDGSVPHTSPALKHWHPASRHYSAGSGLYSESARNAEKRNSRAEAQIDLVFRVFSSILGPFGLFPGVLSLADAITNNISSITECIQ